MAANYCGETSFWQSLCCIAVAPAMVASISILEPLATVSASRKDLAEKTHASIRKSLEQPVVWSASVQDKNRIEGGQFILVAE